MGQNMKKVGKHTQKKLKKNRRSLKLRRMEEKKMRRGPK